MTRLILQPGDSSREITHAVRGARTLGIEVCGAGVIVEMDDVAVGDVPFCCEIMRRQGITVPKPDFYPKWLGGWMHRMWFTVEAAWLKPTVQDGQFFVKSADEYKAYPARILDTGDRFPDDGSLILSEVVTFVQEWRYYVANGSVVTTGWYDGSDEDEPAPELTGLVWPAGFCGAVDFGRLDTGEIALVESHHPFACGWYGEDPELFVMWLIEGWRSLR